MSGQVLCAFLIDVEAQQCYGLNDKNERIVAYAVSTAKAGTGQQADSFQTPLGRHRIVGLAGLHAPKNTVFIGRIPQPHRYGPNASRDYSGRTDWILSRVFWLGGCEEGYNLGGRCDTQARMIYMHGSPDEVDFTEPGSIGCIRMRNDDIVALSHQVFLGMSVDIVPKCG